MEVLVIWSRSCTCRQPDVRYTTPDDLRALLKHHSRRQGTPVRAVMSTWGFSVGATGTAAGHLFTGSSPIEALAEGLKVCEEQQCDGSVGFGGSPDEKGTIS